MKKLTTLSMIFLLITAAIKIQASTIGNETKNEVRKENNFPGKYPETDVSEFDRTSFIVEFGDKANVVWEKSGNLHEASFIKDGQQTSAYFDFDSKLVGTTIAKNFFDLPIAGQKEIETKYKDYIVGSIVLFTAPKANESDIRIYGNMFDMANNYFVQLTKKDSKIILQVNPLGNVFFFKNL